MKPIGIYLFLLSVLVSCSSHQEERRVRSAYYWSTTFEHDSLKQAFYQHHAISRLYVRYFDVVKDKNGLIMPNATIDFKSSPPKDLEIVPTIFIVNNCMKEENRSLPELILKRVLQINKTHRLGKVNEIQIDCDWTRTTQTIYFRFLSTLRQLAKAEGIVVSATIRLHQLAIAPPPVERGTLMVYNTGDFTRLDKSKPILDIADVKPYLRYLKKYPLPLNAAYPIYRWNLLFRDKEFVGIVHHSHQYPMLSTDSIVVREPADLDIIETQRMLNKERRELHQEIILFDISKQNIQRYSTQTYEKIYNP